jgi:hypothetical protein
MTFGGGLIALLPVALFFVSCSSRYLNKAVEEILCSFVGLLLTVTIQFALKMSWDFPRVLPATGAFVRLIFKVDRLWIVLAGTIISVFVL